MPSSAPTAGTFLPPVRTGRRGCGTRLGDAATGRPRCPPLAHHGSVERAAFSPDGRRVLTTAVQEARLWDAATGESLGHSLSAGDSCLINCAAFDPEGHRVLIAGR